MNDTFTSVTLLFATIRQTLLDAGMTIERILGVRDIIVTGVGCLARVRHVVVSPTVSAIGVTLGQDADVLEVAAGDPEGCFPFDTTTGGSVEAQISWDAEQKRLYMHIRPLGGHLCYRAEIYFGTGRAFVTHEDPPDMVKFPDFKVSGGPYLPLGV